MLRIPCSLRRVMVELGGHVVEHAAYGRGGVARQQRATAPGPAWRSRERQGRLMRSGFAPALAIEATGLVKVFGKTRAVDGVDLRVPPGMVYGVLGPNGAGKTTTIKMLATLLQPDGGTARVFGHDIVREAATVRSLMSLTGQFASVDEDLTGRENLILLGRLFGYSRRQARARTDELLGAFDLEEAAGRLVKTYSGGMRRRLDIAASIVVTPDLLFLDEPTTGLDPRSRNQVWDIVRALVAGGTTVLLTTQYLDEADQLADRIAIIDHGRVIAEGTSGELKAEVGAGALHVRLRDPGQRPVAERTLTNALGVPVHQESDPAALSARVADSERVAQALAALLRQGVTVSEFALGQPSLDEVFLALTGHPAESTEDTDDAITGNTGLREDAA
jgi:ABC-2 type transport system ATP-binding protein